jgi:hypothetical protein
MIRSWLDEIDLVEPSDCLQTENGWADMSEIYIDRFLKGVLLRILITLFQK